MLLEQSKNFIDVGNRQVSESIFFMETKDTIYSLPHYTAIGCRPLALGFIMNMYFDCPVFRTSVKNYPGFGEYAKELLVNGEELIEEPQIHFNARTMLWELKNGKSRKVELTEECQIRYFDPKTGLPARNGRRVPEEYGLLPPYFKMSPKGVRTIIRFHGQYQPLVIDATHELNESVPHVGMRRIIV